MNGDFSGKWDAMTVSERIDHLIADWKSIRGTSDPLILQVAASVAHHVLKQAQSEIEQLRLCGEERVANLRSYDAELREQVARTRRERDEARRSLCECLACGACDSKMGEWFDDDGRHLLARDAAKERGWDCFEENGK
jgi:hypothetical protein